MITVRVKREIMKGVTIIDLRLFYYTFIKIEKTRSDVSVI